MTVRHRGCDLGRLITCLVLTTGCEATPPSGGAAPGVVQVSAAVHAAELELRVGSIDDPLYSLSAIAALEVDETGNIYTLHPQEQMIRVFSPEGSLLRTIGSRGEGPAEFQSAGSFGFLADTIWVLDFSNYRISQFLSSGEYLGSFTVPFETTGDFFSVQPPRARGVLHDGTIWGEPVVLANLVLDGTHTHKEVVRLERDGSLRDVIARVPVGRNQWGIADPADLRSGGMFRRQPFADGPLWRFVPHQNAIIVADREVTARADGSHFAVVKLSFAGDTLFARAYVTHSRPIRSTEVDSIITATVDALLNSPLGRNRNLAPGMARTWVEFDFYRPVERPAVTDLFMGRRGDIWLQESDLGDVWLRLDADGQPLQRIEFPADVTLFQADGDLVWGSEVDAFGVPYAVRYRVPGT